MDYAPTILKLPLGHGMVVNEVKPICLFTIHGEKIASFKQILNYRHPNSLYIVNRGWAASLRTLLQVIRKYTLAFLTSSWLSCLNMLTYLDCSLADMLNDMS